MPANCPVCDTPVVRDEGAVRHYCPNPLPGSGRTGIRALCRARRDGHRGRWLGGAFPAPGAWAGEDPRRLLPAVRGRPESLDRFARKSAENLYANIQKARVRPLARIINALGIPQVGEQTAIDMAAWIAGRWPPADDEPMGGTNGWFARVALALRTLPAEDFQQVMGIGPTVAASAARWFEDPATAGILDDLVDAGVEPVRPPKAAVGGRRVR